MGTSEFWTRFIRDIVKMCSYLSSKVHERISVFKGRGTSYLKFDGYLYFHFEVLAYSSPNKSSAKRIQIFIKSYKYLHSLLREFTA